MKRRDESLLDQIEADISSDAPLGQVLRKCVLLGGRAGSADLREWASRELKGYDGVDLGTVPTYRKVSAAIQADAVVGNYHVRGQQISPMQLPDFTRGAIDESVTLCAGVGELEALLRTAFDDNGACLSLPFGSDLALFMNHEAGDPYQHIERLYWRVSPVAIQGVLDQIRTSLTELVAELRAGMRADEALPSADLADQALSVAIHGKGASDCECRHDERWRLQFGDADRRGRVLDPMEEVRRLCCWSRQCRWPRARRRSVAALAADVVGAPASRS